MSKRLFCQSLLAFASCLVFGQARAAENGVTQDEIVLGMWTPLTGPLALLGTSERDAIQIGIKEINAAGGINGRKLTLVVYDDAGSPQEAISAVRRLITRDNVFALIAGSSSGSTLPVMPIINSAKIPFVASISSNKRLLEPFSKNAFRVYASEVPQAERLVDFALQQGVKKPAIVYTSNDYGIGGEEVVSRRFAKDGVKLIASERYNQADQDFKSQLLRVKAAGADALFVWAFAAEAGIIVRQAKEVGLNVPMYGGGGTATPLFPKAAGEAGVGFLASYVVPELPAESTKPAVVAYKNSLKAVYNGTLPPGRPSEYDLAGYGAIKVVAEGLRRIKGEPTRENFIAALETLKEFDPLTIFPVTFTATNHEGSSQTSVIRVNSSLNWENVK